MRWVILGPSEPFVVLNQGQGYLEGYLAKKPRDEYEALEADLAQIQRELRHPAAVVKDLLVVVRWEGQLTRGMIVSAAGFFVDVFLLDYGVRECCSRNKLYALPEQYQQRSAYGLRIELENPLEENLRDRTVVVNSLRRLSATSARGSITDITSGTTACQNKEADLSGTEDTKPECAPGITEVSTLPNGFKHREIFVKPPNELLLEMIGTRCFLTRLLVQKVKSPLELLCSHYSSLMVVRNALDSMNELPVPVPHEKVRPNMLVLVLWRATLHRGIVGAIFDDRELSYRIEFIDLPGHTESSLLYYTPSRIAHCAPRALIRVRLRKHTRDIDPGDIVTLLCDSVVDNTVYGNLIEGENQTIAINMARSRL